MDLEELLKSHGEDAPSGEDLEYDPVFMELEIAAQPGEEKQAGEEILAAEEPDYKDVSRLALEVLERSHDLRAAIYLGEAQLRLNGLPGFADATTLIRRFLEDYWDSCHPQLDAEDDNDPTMRVNAVLTLTDGDRIIRGVRRAPLTQSRMFGNLSLRHIAVAEGEITAPADMTDVPDASAVSAAFQDTDEDALRTIAQAASRALTDVQAISAKFDAETPGQGPDLDPLIKMLKQAEARLSGALGDPVEAAEDGDAVDEQTDGGAPAPRPAGGGGAINSPNDVINMLDRIIGYYEREEPSSPLPILLLRAKKLVNADFLTIVKNLAPNGLENVHLVGGIEEEEEY
ncbi:type VI secretion system protein TssA [Pseudooceanicola sp.]|uniref:type VI secretion system protein TssA n=1 Tax=Pseudooceanicola sp. TaxID=1914328 RepID=UPI0035C70475